MRNRAVLRAGDTPVVRLLDRLGHSLKDLIAWLEEGRAGPRSLIESLAITTPGGWLTFDIFGAPAAFEPTLIQDRTQAGPAAARARGRKGERRHSLDADRRLSWCASTRTAKCPSALICATMGISKPTLYAHLHAANGVSEEPPAR